MQSGTPTPKANFERDAMAVFKAYCLSCHTGASAPAGLDLSKVEGIRKGGVSGPLFVPGKPDQSLLIRRVKGLDGKPMMPKGFASIGAEKVAGLERWIAEGGSTKLSGDKHWAYTAPVRPKLPAVRNSKWIRNPIDRFVLARLEKEKLTTSAEASKETLLRRVSLDLIGLPPTVQEIDAFLGDKSPSAYEKVVDRLLASPQYGERQARIWLDLARYADTNGYEADRSRVSYKYRDWVIAAFNRNMPYSQFTIEQMAGDLLPGATLDQRIATGFHRNSMFNEEGGVDPEESMFETVMDRVATTSTVFMGSTIACARCHDHKFDPFTQKDFYQMYAFFANNRFQEAGDFNQGQRKFYEPTIKAPTSEQAKKIAKLRSEIGGKRSRLRQPHRTGAFEAWVGSPTVAPEWHVLQPTALKSEGGATMEAMPDGTIVVSGTNPDKETLIVEATPPVGKIGGVKIEPIPDAKFANGGPGRSESGNFVLTGVSLEVNPGDGTMPIGGAVSDFTQGGYDNLDLIYAAGGTNKEGAWAVYPEPAKPHWLLLEPRGYVDAKIFKLKLEFNSVWKKHVFGKFRVSVTEALHPALANLPPAIAAIKEKATRSNEEIETLRDYFERAHPETREARAPILNLNREIAMVEAQVPSALVLAEKPAKGPLTAPMHNRGEFLQPGEKVPAATPAFLPAMPATLKKNRLGLAQWLFRKENPLTARVQVNRMWASYFGRGLVETEEDFGTQGAPPSHPELLDWLACELRESGWNLKHIHKLIVTSATYRQASSTPAKLLERDPMNILLARGPRFRMEAEMIRDTALTASGLLSKKVGGPSVMPYQPDDIWDSPYSGEAWRVATGEDRYRRGLYVYWKRTAPFPSFMAFDSTSRETCTVRRIRTNTPLQALALLNDKAYMECAAALAASQGQVEAAFRACTGRMPTAAESSRLKSLLTSLRAKYRKDPAAARKLVASAATAEGPKAALKRRTPEDAAAWIMLCNVLLNLDETITKS
jgi:hypothetical protein